MNFYVAKQSQQIAPPGAVANFDNEVSGADLTIVNLGSGNLQVTQNGMYRVTFNGSVLEQAGTESNYNARLSVDGVPVPYTITSSTVGAMENSSFCRSVLLPLSAGKILNLNLNGGLSQNTVTRANSVSLEIERLR